MKTRTLALLIFTLGWLSFGAPAQAQQMIPLAEPFQPLPNEFASALVIVPKTHEVLYAFKPDKPHVAASLTKLANALVFVQLKPNMSKVVALRKDDEVGGGRLRVSSGATMTIQDLLYSSITASANNAAMALARISGLSKTTYLKEMSKAVKGIGATHTTFYDFSGMDPRNMTTASDMARIAEITFAEPLIQRAASKVSYTFRVQNTGEIKTLRNTNTLLTHDPDVWVVGGKTGYLEESKYNLVMQARPMTSDGKPVYGQDVIVVVFGAPTKEGQFTAAKRLAQWAWRTH